jgi:cell wall assembly regulator SMI1
MASKHKRVIGTTPEAVAKAETKLGRNFPPSFRAWLLENNGLYVDDVYIFPVRDERDVRKTWDSIVRQYDNGRWFPDYFEDEGLMGQHLLPFASFGSGDYYCFDYNRQRQDGETPIVWWSHETAETEDRAETFAEFVEKVNDGVYDD